MVYGFTVYYGLWLTIYYEFEGRFMVYYEIYGLWVYGLWFIMVYGLLFTMNLKGDLWFTMKFKVYGFTVYDLLWFMVYCEYEGQFTVYYEIYGLS